MVWIALLSSQTAPLFISASCERGAERLRSTFTLPQRGLFRSVKYQTQTFQIKVMVMWNIAHRHRYLMSKCYDQLRMTEANPEARTELRGDRGTGGSHEQQNLWESRQWCTWEPDLKTEMSRTSNACHSGEKKKKWKAPNAGASCPILLWFNNSAVTAGISPRSLNWPNLCILDLCRTPSVLLA